MSQKRIDSLVIAVGGEGSRLSGYFDNIRFSSTKTLLPIYDQPLLKYITDMAFSAGYEKVFLLASFYEEDIKKFVTYFYKNKNIEVVCGGEIGKVGGVTKVLSMIEDRLKQPFIYMDGDIVFESNLLDILSTEYFEGSEIIKCIVSPRDRALTHSRFIVQDKKLIDIKLRLDSPNETLSGFCSMGIMVISDKLFRLLPSYKDMYDLDVVVDKLFKLNDSFIDHIIFQGDWFGIHTKEDIDRINQRNYSWLSSLKK